MKVQCTRCRNKHDEEERIEVPSTEFKGLDAKDLVCPKCSGRNYYRLDDDGKRTRA